AAKFGSSIFTVLGSTLILDFLRTQSDAKYLARPRILTLNNETAEIKITTQESVGVKTTTQGTTTTKAEPERMETGVSLRVTPQINKETGEITMFIYPQVSQATQGNTIISEGKTFTYRDPEVRSAKCTVRIKDGQTVIVGGLIRNDKIETITKLPLLGDLPLIGHIFKHRDKSRDNERELLVFITPHIVKEKEIELASVTQIQPKKFTLPQQREQDTISGIERVAIIESSLDIFEKKNKF
ncbi:MAG: type II and III secretion system protein, partial [Candidatus Omnitrophica bacterium]|nr:type II and III secretion system protein [Candidatus Omnitrophota bacterium]